MQPLRIYRFLFSPAKGARFHLTCCLTSWRRSQSSGRKSHVSQILTSDRADPKYPNFLLAKMATKLQIKQNPAKPCKHHAKHMPCQKTMQNHAMPKGIKSRNSESENSAPCYKAVCPKQLGPFEANAAYIFDLRCVKSGELRAFPGFFCGPEVNTYIQNGTMLETTMFCWCLRWGIESFQGFRTERNNHRMEKAKGLCSHY